MIDILIRLVIVTWFIQFITQLIICKSCELKIELVIDSFITKLTYLKQTVEEILQKNMKGGSKPVYAYMRPCIYAKVYLQHREIPSFMSNGDCLYNKRMLPQLHKSFCYTEDGEYHGLMFLRI